jgi:single-stranded DNA-binding protein
MIIADVYGNVGSDLESKTSKGGKPFVTFSVASNDNEALTWVRCVCFNSELCEYLSSKLRKGTRVQLGGKLRVSVNDKHTNVDFVVDRCVSAYNKDGGNTETGGTAKRAQVSRTEATDLEDAPF